MRILRGEALYFVRHFGNDLGRRDNAYVAAESHNPAEEEAAHRDGDTAAKVLVVKSA